MSASPRARRPIVAGNWKMYTTVAEASNLAGEIVAAVAGTRGADVVICPPFVALTAVYEVIAGTPVLLGAQNVNAAAQGAFTGEVSWTMLQGLCSHVIVGHSERRRYYHESDEEVNEKVRAVLDADMTPIACVGEHLEQRDAGETAPFVTGQVRALLAGVAPEAARRLVIAYEPLWAIGTGRPATGAAAQEVAALIRGVVEEAYGADIAATLRIQYGGSVSGANAPEFAAQPDIDGTLVGGASLKPADFVAIVRAFAA
jgi:triosephosphate isomerase